MSTWRLSQSLFPPSPDEATQFALHRCRRLLPHAQDTGGFFVALLRKGADATIGIDPSAAPLLPGGRAPRVATPGEATTSDGAAAPELQTAEVESAHLAEIERLAALALDDDDDDVDATQPAGKSDADKGKVGDAGGGEGEGEARERAPYSFFQFTPVEGQTEDMRQLAHFYGLRDDFPWSQVTPDRSRSLHSRCPHSRWHGLSLHVFAAHARYPRISPRVIMSF